jgi:hypothetical protein
MPKVETGKSNTGDRKAGAPSATTGEIRAPVHRLLDSPRYQKALRVRLEDSRFVIQDHDLTCGLRAGRIGVR